MEPIIQAILVIIYTAIAIGAGYTYGLMQKQTVHVATLSHERDMKESAEREVTILRQIIGIVAPEQTDDDAPIPELKKRRVMGHQYEPDPEEASWEDDDNPYPRKEY